MKSIYIFIINVFRAMLSVLLNMLSVITSLPSLVVGTSKSILSKSNATAKEYKSRGGFKNHMIAYGYNVGGVFIMLSSLSYVVVFIYGVYINPLKALGSLLGGVLVSAVFTYITANRKSNGLLYI